MNQTLVNQTIRTVAAMLFAGTATLASAQTPTPAERFADQFRQMQALSSGSVSNAFKSAPALQGAPDASIRTESFADRFARLQADSSNSGEFKAPSVSDRPSHATVTESTNRPTLRERIAHFFQRAAATGIN